MTRIYKHIFFDLDHTLWDFDTNAKHTLEDLYSEFKIMELLNAPFDQFLSKYLHHNEIMWDRYHKGFITVDELKWKRMWRTLLEFKCGDEKLARALSKRFLEILPTKSAVFPYAPEILKYLKEKNYSIHLITNGFEQTQWTKLTNCGLTDFFENMITSEGSNSLKPKKEIFDYAMLKAKAVCSECLMIGDNLTADIQGAINAGMDSVYVNHISASASVLPTYTITHLQQLEDIL